MTDFKIKIVCRDCGSEDIVFTIQAHFDSNKQVYVYDSVMDKRYCEDCDDYVGSREEVLYEAESS